MKSVFDKATRDGLITRAGNLSDKSKPQWGKMNVCQMIKHCVLVEEMFMGRKQYKRQFIGRIFGKMGLKRMLKDEAPMPHNSPTLGDFRMKPGDCNVSQEKTKWITLIGEYGHYSNPNFVHWFFGKMSEEQVGWFVYKHIDHHLRQFGV
jgi:hypothetical protein